MIKFKRVEDLSQFNKDFIKIIESDERYFLGADVQYPENLHDLHNNLQFLPERLKIEKIEKLATKLHNKNEYAIHTANLKQPVNHGLVLKKIPRVIKFNQKSWLKSYIDMNADLRNVAKNDFKEDFFKLMNNSVFGETMENERKHRDIKLVTTEKRRKYLVAEPNYHTKKFFS